MEKQTTEVLVLGGGPGGYAAAFYAADLGKKVTLVEKDSRLGGVCLNRGCIPSKALLHNAKLLNEVRESKGKGLEFGEPKIDLNAMRAWKDSILEKLSGGVRALAAKRGVSVEYGRGYFEASDLLRVETEGGQKFFNYDKAIIAVGSVPFVPKAFDLGNKRIMTSDQALEIEEIPERMLIIGGGYIGMELGTVYATLGSRVEIAEVHERILFGADPDLAEPVFEYAKRAYDKVHVNVKIEKMATAGKQISVVFAADGAQREELYDKVLVSVGRGPNTADLGLENTKVKLNERGFIVVNAKQQTEDPSLLAIGDVVGGAMLAHKAAKEARIAVENILGEDSKFEDVVIPAVVFTDPEIAWCGLTETEAKQKGLQVKVARFPWSASGRALTFGRSDGHTKLIAEPETERLLGVGMVGIGAGELISEGALAIELGATVRDIAEVVHPHPTLSETMMEAGEAFYGHATHVYTRKRSQD